MYRYPLDSFHNFLRDLTFRHERDKSDLLGLLGVHYLCHGVHVKSADELRSLLKTEFPPGQVSDRFLLALDAAEVAFNAAREVTRR